MITEKNATAINNSGLGVNRFNLVMTPEVFKVFYSSLYEDKELAVLRELVSNGDDGHTAAGVKGVPVTIHLPTDLVPELVIIDQGIGMSLEDIQSTYTTYGKSTKRDSNDEIGGFGYGAKSPFAISQSFTVQSTKNGITTTFVNFIDDDGPNYTVVSSLHTGQPSGTTVRVPVADPDMQKRLATKAVEGLFELWETPPVVKNSRLTTPPSKIKLIERKDLYFITEINNYASRSITDVASGPFKYRIPVNLLQRVMQLPAYKFLQTAVNASSKIESTETATMIIPRFAVGELELSPSRERIEDSKENEERIRVRLNQIMDTLKIPAITVEQDIDQAFDLVQTHGVKVSDILGRMTDVADYVITFKDKDALIKKILPPRWEATRFNIAAALSQQHYIETIATTSPLAAYADSKLVIPQNLGTVRLLHKPAIPGLGFVHTLAAVLQEAASVSADKSALVATIPINAYNILTRKFRTYTKARWFTKVQTVIIVNPKLKASVSRCFNSGLTNWVDTAYIFTEEDPQQIIPILENTAKYLDCKFTYVLEKDVRAMLKTLPKTTRAAKSTSPTAVAIPCRPIGKMLQGSDNTWSSVDESHVAEVLTYTHVAVCIVDEIRRVNDLIREDVRTVMKFTATNVLYISASDFKNKNHIKTFVEQAKLKAGWSVQEVDTYKVESNVIAYLKSMATGVTFFEEIIAGSLLGKTTLLELYPKAQIIPTYQYSNHKNHFGSFLETDIKAPLLFRCKWLGYVYLSDVKSITQLLDKADVALLKTAITSYTHNRFR
jgi:hypothetical protein